MSNEHTPGPWRVEPTISPPEKYICADKPEGQAELARVYDWAEYGGGLPAEANARLMAAAPELLEALWGCVCELDGLGVLMSEETAACSAIAKAAIATATTREEEA